MTDIPSDPCDSVGFVNAYSLTILLGLEAGAR